MVVDVGSVVLNVLAIWRFCCWRCVQVHDGQWVGQTQRQIYIYLWKRSLANTSALVSISVCEYRDSTSVIARDAYEIPLSWLASSGCVMIAHNPCTLPSTMFDVRFNGSKYAVVMFLQRLAFIASNAFYSCAHHFKGSLALVRRCNGSDSTAQPFM